jgi:radical SAM-linked protein
MAEGIEVMSFRRIPEGKASNAMSLVAAADYEIRFREGCEPEGNWQERFDAFTGCESILITKKTKKSERELDIRPLIYKIERRENCIFMQVATGSSENLKPELVMEAFADFAGITFPEFPFCIHRLEVYADQGTENAHRFISLEDLGEDF